MSIPKSRRKIIRRGKILSFDVCGIKKLCALKAKGEKKKRILSFLLLLVRLFFKSFTTPLKLKRQCHRRENPAAPATKGVSLFVERRRPSNSRIPNFITKIECRHDDGIVSLVCSVPTQRSIVQFLINFSFSFFKLQQMF